MSLNWHFSSVRLRRWARWPLPSGFGDHLHFSKGLKQATEAASTWHLVIWVCRVFSTYCPHAGCQTPSVTNAYQWERARSCAFTPPSLELQWNKDRWKVNTREGCESTISVRGRAPAFLKSLLQSFGLRSFDFFSFVLEQLAVSSNGFLSPRAGSTLWQSFLSRPYWLESVKTWPWLGTRHHLENWGELMSLCLSPRAPKSLSLLSPKLSSELSLDFFKLSVERTRQTPCPKLNSPQTRSFLISCLCQWHPSLPVSGTSYVLLLSSTHLHTPSIYHQIMLLLHSDRVIF